ncbi:MAG: ribosome small subunit-dependent GTPase A [Bacteroidaceae bacterium]|nr:ribosome small subunit-dependent GTPase A [Bacteroidaceae bacterium]
MQGTVIKSSGSIYGVRAMDGSLVDCRVKGNFRLKGIKSTNPVAVGDHVKFDVREDGTAYIVEILERRNYIVRKASNLSKQSHILAANLDLCFLIVTISHPATATTFIDRFLAAAEAYRVPVVLVFNKVDIYDEAERAELEYLTALYKSIGYPCLHTSATDGLGIDALKEMMRGKVSLLAGNSGVGKSSIVNAIAPEVAARVGEISRTHDTGMHTTTYTEMFEFMPQSYIVDTPGVKGFGTYDMEVEEISHYFVEFFELSKDCRYGNCTHTHEPGCAVLEALESGRLAPSRYQSYLSMLEDKDEGKYRASE